MTSKYTHQHPCSCVSCKSELRSTASLPQHYHSCTQHLYPLKPKSFGVCKECNKNIVGYTKKQFCNSSCAAINSNKVRSSSSRVAQTLSLKATLQVKFPSKSKPLKKPYRYGSFSAIRFCSVCNKLMRTNNVTCSKPCLRKHLSSKGLSATFQRVCKKSHPFTDKLGRTFVFDSTWEDALAVRLDILNVQWTRPEPVKYVTADGKEHNYFPDFYLPDHNLYIDPKNSYVQTVQREKLEIVSKLLTLVILSTKKECQEFTI